MKKYRRDIYLIGGVVFLGILFSVFFLFTHGENGVVKVSVDGNVVGEYSLLEDANIDIKGDGGNNTLVISGQKAYMSDADCPDKLCVRMGKINKVGQSIICLPHKVVIAVVSGEENEIDTMVGVAP